MDRSSVVDDALAGSVHSGAVPGLVAAVVDREQVRYERAVGVADLRTGAPMETDAIFRIASLTKLATAIAALQLVDRGPLGLETPVGDILGAFDALPVLVGFDGEAPVLRPPRGRATVRQLLTNTAGLGYDTFEENLLRYQQATGTPNIAEGSLEAFELPLVADPGSAFTYGTSYDWLGRVVERVSGSPLDQYLLRHVFEPLAMTDTVATLRPDQRSRLLPAHVRGHGAAWTASDVVDPVAPEFVPGGHALFSTVGDYAVLLRMLLAGGRVGDHVVLDPGLVDAMFENQIGHLQVPTHVSRRPDYSADLVCESGMRWGFGMALSGDRGAGLRPPGSGGWAGAYNAFYWLDRQHGLAGLFFTQTLPFYDPDVVEACHQFERAAYHAFVDLSEMTTTSQGPGESNENR